MKYITMNLSEFEKKASTTFEKEAVLGLKSPYCSKIEVSDDNSIFIRLKAEKKDINTAPLFVIGILKDEDKITLINVSGDFSPVETLIESQRFSSLSDLFSSIVSSLIKNDAEFLSQIEKEAEEVEERIIDGIDTNFFPLLTKRKRIVGQFEAFYMDMLSILDVLEDIEEVSNKSLEQKISRLQVYARRIGQSITEIRSEGESLQLEKENRTMGLLTVITTIFLPLTLLTGWYGMNWKGMKELQWRYGYIFFIVLALIIVVLEILFFIKRGFFLEKGKKKTRNHPGP